MMKSNVFAKPSLLFAILMVTGSGVVARVMAQDSTTQGGTAASMCCWVDLKTGKRVPTVPATGINYGAMVDNLNSGGKWIDVGVAVISTDGKYARNSKTGQQYGKEPDGCWVDLKTGKRVPTAPATGINYGAMVDNLNSGGKWIDVGVAILDIDSKYARNSKTGAQYGREACESNNNAATTTPTPTPTPNKPTPIFVRNYQPGEVFVGYMFLRAPGETAKNSNGFAVQMFYNFKPNLGIGGDLACAWGSGRLGTTIDVRLQRCTYTFGPQINTKPNGKVQFFFHPLVGAVHDANQTTAGTLISKSSANALALSIGGGFNVKMNSRVEVRPIQVDYQPTHFGGFWQHNVRIATGIVFKFGKEKELPTW